ncbi:MAG: hypothetical protein N2039_03835 [Gemmataceae bacterium]|nr:hypothetical protein [Gemmataceae bacterium]
MKSLVACVFVLSVTLIARGQEARWTRIDVKDGRCSIEFPGKPMDPGQLNKSKGQQLILEVLDGKGAYMLQHNQFEKAVDVKDADLVKRIFDGGQNGLEKALKGNISRADEGEFKGFPTREIEMEVANLGIYRVKFVLTPNRFYQVTAAGPKEFTSGPDVERFIKSFKIDD